MLLIFISIDIYISLADLFYLMVVSASILDTAC